MSSPHANETLASHILSVGAFMRRLFESIRETQQVSGMQFYVLGTLVEAGPLKMTDLTARLDITKGNLTYHIDRMEKAGLLTRTASPEDRRVTHIALTPAGRDLYDGVMGELRSRLERLADNIPEAELATIQAGLGLLLGRAELLEWR